MILILIKYLINIKMSSDSGYTLEQLRKMNSTSKWNHRIILPENDISSVFTFGSPAGHLSSR